MARFFAPKRFRERKQDHINRQTELAAVQVSLICVSMCALDKHLASVNSKGKCLMVPDAFRILQGKDTEKTRISSSF